MTVNRAAIVTLVASIAGCGLTSWASWACVLAIFYVWCAYLVTLARQGHAATKRHAFEEHCRKSDEAEAKKAKKGGVPDTDTIGIIDEDLFLWDNLWEDD